MFSTIGIEALVRVLWLVATVATAAAYILLIKRFERPKIVPGMRPWIRATPFALGGIVSLLLTVRYFSVTPALDITEPRYWFGFVLGLGTHTLFYFALLWSLCRLILVLFGEQYDPQQQRS